VGKVAYLGSDQDRHAIGQDEADVGKRDFFR